MAPFPPGVGIEQVDDAEARLRQPVQQRFGLRIEQPHIAATMVIQGRNRPGKPIAVEFGTDKADTGMRARIVNQMLAAPATDFQMHRCDRHIEQAAGAGRRRAVGVDGQLGKAFSQPVRLRGPKSPAAATAEIALAGFPRRLGIKVRL